MNSYFSSVEQQDRPELQGRPVAVVPVVAETTCCIAASYEAKRFGVRTGTRVSDARRLCPGIQLVEARPRRYVEVHHRMIEAVDSCVPVASVRSIDEVSCRLVGGERRPDEAERIAVRVKAAIRAALGPHLRCSIGLGPNVLLAKIAAGIQKPDGMTMFLPQDLPDCLHCLELRDIPGVGPRMEERLRRLDINTVEQLCELSAAEMGRAWNSRWLGEIWQRSLAGDEVPEAPHARRSLGHSHVLAPAWRTEARARAVLMRLVEKAAARLRSIDFWTDSIRVAVQSLQAPPWEAHAKLGFCQDTLTLVHAAVALWERKKIGTPLKLGVVFGNLAGGPNVAPSLFDEDRKRLGLSLAVDRLNRKYGDHSVYFAGMFGAQRQAPTRIAFGSIPDLEATDE